MFHALLTLIHALLVHSCAEAARVLLAYAAPEIPSPVAFVAGIVLGVIVIELAATLLGRPHADE